MNAWMWIEKYYTLIYKVYTYILKASDIFRNENTYETFSRCRTHRYKTTYPRLDLPWHDLGVHILILPTPTPTPTHTSINLSSRQQIHEPGPADQTWGNKINLQPWLDHVLRCRSPSCRPGNMSPHMTSLPTPNMLLPPEGGHPLMSSRQQDYKQLMQSSPPSAWRHVEQEIEAYKEVKGTSWNCDH